MIDKYILSNGEQMALLSNSKEGNKMLLSKKKKKKKKKWRYRRKSDQAELPTLVIINTFVEIDR